jgi:hypothetical protein
LNHQSNYAQTTKEANIMKKSIIALTLALSSATAFAATYEAKIPESVTTPDVVQTKTMGKLHFTDGMPSP